MTRFDLIIIGAGPGGADLAQLATEHDLTVALIEKDVLGGTCLNRGCIPTKALLHLAEFQHNLHHLNEEGLFSDGALDPVEIMQEKALAYRDKIVHGQRNGLEGSIKRNKKITLYHDHGQILGGGEVLLMNSGERLHAEYIVLATGSSPHIPPIPGAGSKLVKTSDDFLDERIHHDVWDFSSIVIVGGGVIGVELADYFQSQGKHVTIIEALDRILANMDIQISRSLQQDFKKRGITCITSARVDSITETQEGLEISYQDSKSSEHRNLRADQVLLATGRRANTEGLLADGLALNMDRGAVLVDTNYQTSLPNVYAIGDVRSGSKLLAHEASLDAKRVLQIILGKNLEPAPVVPLCVYTTPEISQVGITEEMARAQGISTLTGKASTLANARTQIAGGRRGYINLVFAEEDLQLIGGQWFGERATDFVDELALAINQKLTLHDLAKQCHAHPSYGESLGMAVQQALAKI